MIEKIWESKPPSSFARSLYRAPIWLYRAGLGFLLGGRFLLLTHTGRKSGLDRYTVLEVVAQERDKKVYFVVSGFGEKSDWYQNILKNQQVMVQVSRQSWPARAEKLSPEQAGEVLLDYGRRHPRALQTLARWMGYRIDRTEADYRELGRFLPVVGLYPDHD